MRLIVLLLPVRASGILGHLLLVLKVALVVLLLLLPLHGFLRLQHIFDVSFHRLGQLAARVNGRIRLGHRVLVVDIHAPTTRPVSPTHHKTRLHSISQSLNLP